MGSLIKSIAHFVERIFIIALDISGILLGVFLTWLGWWVLAGQEVGKVIGALILFLGVAALIIHLGHYYSWKLTKWIFGDGDYFTTRSQHQGENANNEKQGQDNHR